MTEQPSTARETSEGEVPEDPTVEADEGSSEEPGPGDSEGARPAPPPDRPPSEGDGGQADR